MPLLKAVIRPSKVDDVRAALEKFGAGEMTVSEVREQGKEQGHASVYRGREYNTGLVPKLELEIVIPDALTDDAVRAIIAAARTGAVGDGRVLVLPVVETHSIRTRGLHVD